MTTDERATLTLTWRGVPWETRDLFARWLSSELARLGIQKLCRLEVQAALMSLDGDAPEDGDTPEDKIGQRVDILRRDADKSRAEILAIMDALDRGELADGAEVGP